MGEKKQASFTNTEVILSKNNHIIDKDHKSYLTVAHVGLLIIVILIVLIGVFITGHKKPKVVVSKPPTVTAAEKESALANMGAAYKTAPNVQPTVTNALNNLQSEISKTPSTDKNRLLILNISAAQVAAQVSNPIAKQYATEALKLYPPNNSNTPAAKGYTDIVKTKLIAISKGDYATAN